MKLDPLTSAYMKVINENADSGKVEGQSLVVGADFGDPKNKKNVTSFYNDSGDAKVKKEVESPKEAPAELNSNTSESEPKEEKEKGKTLTKKGDTLEDSRNPFDALYNKIISEDAFDFSTEDNSLTPDSSFGGPEGIGQMDDMDEEDMDDESEEEESEEEESEEDEHEDLESLVSQLKELVGKLESHLEGHIEHEEEEEEGEEGEEGEESEEGEYGDEDEEDEDLSEESVEAEELGHALVDQDKLEAGLTKNTWGKLKSATPKTGKKKSLVKGKKVTGKPESFENKEGINKYQKQGNSYDVGGVKAGKFIFDDQSGE